MYREGHCYFHAHIQRIRSPPQRSQENSWVTTPVWAQRWHWPWEPQLRDGEQVWKEQVHFCTCESASYHEPLMQLEKNEIISKKKKAFLGLYNSVISGQRSSSWLFLQILVKNNTGPQKVTTINMALLRSGSFSLLGWNNLISGNGSSNCY